MKKRPTKKQLAARAKFVAMAKARRKKRGENPDSRLTMAHLDMNGNALAKNGGDHVELHPGLDLWARGARYGTIKKISVDGIATVKMDHPGVKRLQRIPVGRLKLTTSPNPRKRRKNPKTPPARGQFQVAALKGSKVFYLSGIGLSDNRETASNFGALGTARKIANQVRGVASRFGISKVAVVTKHDTAAEIRGFFAGKK